MTLLLLIPVWALLLVVIAGCCHAAQLGDHRPSASR